MAAYNDMLNKSLDTLTLKLQTLTGLRVTTEPRSINPPCVFVDAPSVQDFNGRVAKVIYPIRVIGSGPANLETLRKLLAMCSDIINANIGAMDANPTMISIGGQDFAAYDINLNIGAMA